MLPLTYQIPSSLKERLTINEAPNAKSCRCFSAENFTIGINDRLVAAGQKKSLTGRSYGYTVIKILGPRNTDAQVASLGIGDVGLWAIMALT